MNKGVKLLISALFLAAGSLSAQTIQPDTLLVGAVSAMEEQSQDYDNSDFTFTESQLDDDADAAQTVSSIVSSADDQYMSEVGYLWSAMRFKVRAYDNMYSTSYLNGLAFNDLETGRFNYSLLGGLNDATRNKEGVTGFDNNTFGITGIGGGDNTNLRASQFQQGHKITLSACNRNYKSRAMYTFATGLLNNGWAFAGTIGYRWSDEGVIEGTYYNSFSYLFSAEKRINDDHTFSFVTFGSPTERAQQSASTEEAYWLANSHYYNPNWGYQDGHKRNARVVNDFEPTAILTWDWKIDESTKLSTSFAYKYSMYSNTALGWTGEAYDPRPDYYKNLPSSIFDVYDETKNNPTYLGQNPYLLDQYNTLVDYWTASKANRQINWDQLYYVNRQNEAAGGEALYYLERRHNDQQVWALSSTYNKSFNQHHKLGLGVQLNATLGMHYKTMDDLLGGTKYTDLDKFALNDYGRNSIQAQSDLRHPNRMIGVGDKFGYDYKTNVRKATLWGQYLFNQGPINLKVAGHLEATGMERDGLMQNGQGQVLTREGYYVDNSYGSSGWAHFLGGGAKAMLTWRPIANQRFALAAGYEAKAPLVRNAFVAPRVQNNYVDNLSLEDIYTAEASWAFRWGDFSGKVTGYYTRFENQVEQTAFYNDAKSTFTYLTMSKIGKQHYGVEAAFNYQFTSAFSAHLIGTWSEAEYTNNPYAQLNSEGMDYDDNKKLNTWKSPKGEELPLRVIAKGLHEGSTPLTAITLGFNYNVNSWFFEANVNYYDRVYLEFSQYRRLTNIVGNYEASSIDAEGRLVYDVSKKELDENGGILWRQDGTIRKMFAAKQEKFDGGFMLDASIGRYIRLKNSRTMSINLSLQNMTNNTNMRTGGYEQNRDDYYYGIDDSKGLAKSYKFSKNAKYYYANALNAFLNVNFRF